MKNSSIIKFTKKIKKINAALNPNSGFADKLLSPGTLFGDIWESMDTSEIFRKNSAFSFVFKIDKLNEYALAIVDNAAVCIPKGYDKEEMDEYTCINTVIDCLNEQEGEGHVFIFWLLMILALDTGNKDENLKTICNYVRMLNITNSEAKDITKIVSAVYEEKNIEGIENESIKTRFENLIKIYEKR